MDLYERGTVLGEGTFGSVYKATNKQTGQVVAIKKIKLGNAKEGLNVTALREIKLLKEMKSPHIIALHDVFEHKKSLNLVMEYMASDLEAIIKDHSIVLSPANVKSYMKMILQGLSACHKRWVVHRDVKPNNCLLAPTGELKLADFGLARIFGSPGRYTNQVFARWYRPPELFFGATMYGAAIDVWAAGCVFAELLLRRPWLPGETDIDQLGKIFQAVGTPREEVWPGCTSLPNYMEFHAVPPTPWNTMFPKASDDALELLSQMVQLDPKRRLSSEEALNHRYFITFPPATPSDKLPKPVSRESAPLMQAPVPTVRIIRPSNAPAQVLEADAAAESAISAALAAAAAADGPPAAKRRLAEGAADTEDPLPE